MSQVNASADKLIDALARSSYLVTAAITSVSAEFDLSLTQGRVLGILRDRRLQMNELAEYLGLQRSTLSGLVDRGEQRGLLIRSRSAEDGRGITVGLTEAGKILAAQAEPKISAALAEVTGRLSASERLTLTTLLEKALGPVPASAL